MNKDFKENLNQYDTDLQMNDSALKQALENTELIKLKDAKSISGLRHEVNTLKLEVKRQQYNIKSNEGRLASKDNELIKNHSVIDKLNQDVSAATIKESELKKVVERVGMLEELVKQINTLKLQVKKFKQKSETTEATLASKDVELTIAYELINSFKKDTLTLTDQLETV